MAALETISSSAGDTRTLWNHRLNVENRFWWAWQTEYLAKLRKSLKSSNTVKKIQPNDVVIVYQANTPRAFWKLGRITEVFRSKDDGVVRAANVKTDLGILKRSTAHLYHLEQSDHDLDAGENEFNGEHELVNCESTDPSSIEPSEPVPTTLTSLSGRILRPALDPSEYIIGDPVGWRDRASNQRRIGKPTTRRLLPNFDVSLP